MGSSLFGVGGPARAEALPEWPTSVCSLTVVDRRVRAPVHRQPRFPVRRWREPRIFFVYLSVNSASIHTKKISSGLGLLANPEARRQSTTQRDQCIRSPGPEVHPGGVARSVSGGQQSSELLHARAPAALPPTLDGEEPIFRPGPGGLAGAVARSGQSQVGAHVLRPRAVLHRPCRCGVVRPRPALRLWHRICRPHA